MCGEGEWLLWAVVFAGMPFAMWFLGYAMGAREQRRNDERQVRRLERDLDAMKRGRGVTFSREVDVPEAPPPSDGPKSKRRRGRG